MVKAVCEIDIRETCFSEHCFIPFGQSPVRVTCGIFQSAISFCLDNNTSKTHPATQSSNENLSNEILRYNGRNSREKASSKYLAQVVG
jgi:hypothetical protein